MPTPVSATWMQTKAPGATPWRCAVSRSRVAALVETRRVPPAGIASRALIATLISADSSWRASARMPAPASAATTRVTSSPSNGRRVRPEVVEQGRGIDIGELGDLMPAEGEQLAGGGAGALAGAADGVDVAAQGVVPGQAGAEQPGVAADRGELVVEVVGHAAGEPAHRLHLQGAAQRFLGLGARRDDADLLQGEVHLVGDRLEEVALVGAPGAVAREVVEHEQREAVGAEAERVPQQAADALALVQQGRAAFAGEARVGVVGVRLQRRAHLPQVAQGLGKASMG